MGIKEAERKGKTQTEKDRRRNNSVAVFISPVKNLSARQ
jgi:hypothetical protein